MNSMMIVQLNLYVSYQKSCGTGYFYIHPQMFSEHHSQLNIDSFQPINYDVKSTNNIPNDLFTSISSSSSNESLSKYVSTNSLYYIDRNIDVNIDSDLINMVNDQKQFGTHKFDQLYTNGLYVQSIMIRERDDTFIPFKCKVEIVQHNELQSFWILFEKYISEYNIIIDSRMNLIIPYAIIRYNDNVLIYDVQTTKIITIYDYCNTYFKTNIDELNMSQIKEIFIIKLLLTYYLYYLDIPWNITNIINSMKLVHRNNSHGNGSNNIHRFSDQIMHHKSLETSSNNHLTTIDTIINYIGNIKQSVVDINNIKELIKNISKYFSIDMLTTTGSCRLEVWKLNNLSMYELYVTLLFLKNNNFQFIISKI